MSGQLTSVKNNLRLLNLVNNLAPFFENCYSLISVREYARLIKISPPTASKLLKEFAKLGYLSQKAEHGRIFFSLTNNAKDVTDICRIYWKKKLERVSKALELKMTGGSAVLFGSLSKAEATPTSDVDIAVFAPVKKQIELSKFEKELGRKISLHWFVSVSKIKNTQLLNNIINGVILFGKIKW